jgi:hypothetical protein
MIAVSAVSDPIQLGERDSNQRGDLGRLLDPIRREQRRYDDGTPTNAILEEFRAFAKRKVNANKCDSVSDAHYLGR